MEEMRITPHFKLGAHRMSKSQYLAPRACTHPLFLNFFCMPIARKPKMEVRAPALRERGSNEPRDDGAATLRLDGSDPPVIIFCLARSLGLGTPAWG